MAGQYSKTCKDCRKEQESGLKEEKPMAKQKAQAPKSEKPENGLGHKKPRMSGRMCRQAFRPRQTRKQQADFLHTWK